MFDVMTTLNISATEFYASETVNDGYDLYATASNKDDILFLNMFSGKSVRSASKVTAQCLNESIRRQSGDYHRCFGDCRQLGSTLE